ncbi:hypothetical protein CsSME_00024003 [Camellia sinensis var. sinensis]
MKLILNLAATWKYFLYKQVEFEIEVYDIWRTNMKVFIYCINTWNLKFNCRKFYNYDLEITIKIVESLRDDIYAGKLKSRSEIKDALKKCVLDLMGYIN